MLQASHVQHLPGRGGIGVPLSVGGTICFIARCEALMTICVILYETTVVENVIVDWGILALTLEVTELLALLASHPVHCRDC
jgi:hypothetical protein